MAALNGQPGAAPDALEELETALLLEAVRQRFGFDFRDYEPAAVRARLHALMRARGLRTLSALQNRVLHDAQTGAALLRALSVAPAALFDAPDEAQRLRLALDGLRAAAVPKVWLAECAGAQQAWTVAILLFEQGLHARTELFVTIGNEQLLAEARAAHCPVAELAAGAENYRRSGGSARFTDYFDIAHGRARLLPALQRRITWAQYNLVTDASCNEFDLIVCRRALPDFGPLLRRRVLHLLHESLARLGVLVLDRPFGPDDALGASYQAMFDQAAWYKRIV